MNGLTSLVKYGLSSCRGGWGYHYCREGVYNQSPLGSLQFNRTKTESHFLFETFEGPSLSGGLDNRWLGRNYNEHNAKVVKDLTDSNNHVVHFPVPNWNGNFFSPPVQNGDSSGNPYVVKFRYFATQSSAGGCIGYYDTERTSLNSQSWILCDDQGGSLMSSNGQWISCQFLVPAEIEEFRVVVGDRRSEGGNAYFDDIQLASGSETTCTGIDVPKQTPTGREGYSSEIVDKLSTLLTAGRLGASAKEVIVAAFDDAGSAEDGLRIAQQLIISTGEFHSTNVVQSSNQARESITFPEPTGKPYRAIVYILLNGGCDSFNMLTPYTCSNGLYESYLGK